MCEGQCWRLRASDPVRWDTLRTDCQAGVGVALRGAPRKGARGLNKGWGSGRRGQVGSRISAWLNAEPLRRTNMTREGCDIDSGGAPPQDTVL